MLIAYDDRLFFIHHTAMELLIQSMGMEEKLTGLV